MAALESLNLNFERLVTSLKVERIEEFGDVNVHEKEPVL
jgi:hypothetical protein